MKRTALTLLTLLALAASAHAAASHGFTIAIPDGWEERSDSGIPSAVFYAVDPAPITAFPARMVVEITNAPIGNAAPITFYEALVRKGGASEVESSLTLVQHHGVTVRRMELRLTAQGTRRRLFIYLLPRGPVTAAVSFMCSDLEADALLPVFEATIQRFQGLQHPTPPTRVISPGDAIAFRIGQTIAYGLLALFALWCAIKLQKWLKL